MRLPDPSRSRAVLLGVAEYADAAIEPIPAVERNLRDLKHVLGESFTADNCEILRPEFADRPAAQVARLGKNAEDMFLVYYCGHAARGSDGELMLTLSDTVWEELEYTGLRIGELRKAIMESNARIRVLVLDCCFSGSAIHPVLDAGVSNAIIDAAGIEGAFILTSSAANLPSNAPAGRTYTTFTGAMLDILRNGIPGDSEFVSLNDLYKELDWKLRAGGNPAPKRLNNGTASDIALARNQAYDGGTGRGPGLSYVAMYSQVADPDNEAGARIIALENLIDKAQKGTPGFKTALPVIARNADLPLLFRVNAIVYLARLGDSEAALESLVTITPEASPDLLDEAERVLALPERTSEWLEQLKGQRWEAPKLIFDKLHTQLSDSDLWGIHMARLLRALGLDVATCVVAARQLAGDLDDVELASSLVRGLRRDRSLSEEERSQLDEALSPPGQAQSEPGSPGSGSSR
ncbi:MAG: hypothetical protein HOV86_01465 [Thermoactinospora sp.]|nr:hypothetical protein [Thermoactinospora sp.]